MRLTSRFGVIVVVAAILGLRSICIAAQPITVRFDPNKPNEKSAPVWLGYLLARVAYHEKHKLPIPAAGEIVPSLEEEVDARSAASQIYRELTAKDAKLKDAYWDALAEVDRRGFMAAYVWTFLRRQSWPASARPSNLAAFGTWKKQALPNHKPQTYGWIEAGKS